MLKLTLLFPGVSVQIVASPLVIASVVILSTFTLAHVLSQLNEWKGGFVSSFRLEYHDY